MRVLLVYPETPDTFWSFKHVVRLVSRKAAFPPLGLLTVAAMLPREWELRLRDLNASPLTGEDLRWADYAMVSAMLVQRASVEAIVERCVACGKPVIAGGPLFTTGRAAFPRIQHFVVGEAEGVIAQLVCPRRYPTCSWTVVGGPSRVTGQAARPFSRGQLGRRLRLGSEHSGTAPGIAFRDDRSVKSD